MDWPRFIVIVLYALGLVLPVWGSVRAYRHAKHTLEAHAAAVDQYQRLHDEHSAAMERLQERGLPRDEDDAERERLVAKFRARVASLDIELTTYGTLPTLGERAVLKALRLVGSGNLGNAITVGAGLVLGTVASIVALYLPPA